MYDKEKSAVRVAYERRNRDLGLHVPDAVLMKDIEAVCVMSRDRLLRGTI